LNVHRVSDVRQIEIHAAKILVSEPSPVGVEKYKSSGSDQILTTVLSRR
jgi:hypothetical protein